MGLKLNSLSILLVSFGALAQDCLILEPGQQDLYGNLCDSSWRLCGHYYKFGFRIDRTREVSPEAAIRWCEERVKHGSRNKKQIVREKLGPFVSFDFLEIKGDVKKSEVTQLEYYDVMRESEVYRSWLASGKQGINPAAPSLEGEIFHWETFPRDCDTREMPDGSKICPDHPVYKVNAWDVDRFIEEINRQAEADIYALPTKKEFDNLAKATLSAATSDEILKKIAWIEENSGNHPHKVCTTAASVAPGSIDMPAPYNQLCDVLGNVWEWTQSKDQNGDRFRYGSSWGLPAQTLRSSFRATLGPSFDGSHLGFRLIKRSGGK